MTAGTLQQKPQKVTMLTTKGITGKNLYRLRMPVSKDI